MASDNLWLSSRMDGGAKIRSMGCKTVTVLHTMIIEQRKALVFRALRECLDFSFSPDSVSVTETLLGDLKICAARQRRRC